MDPVTGLAYARISLGSVSLLSPRRAAKVFRLDRGANPQLPYMTRLFASREVALGAITLMTTGAVRRQVIQAGIAVDAADALAGVAAAASGSVSKTTGFLLAAPALGAVAAGVAGLQD